jgi:hypothetical protein
MPVSYLTPEQLAEHQALESEIMRRRGERILAADRAKAEVSTNSPPSPQKNAPHVTVVDGAKEPKLTPAQAKEMAAAYRENYATYYADSPEIIELLEERLAAAFKADGWKLEPLTPNDRLKLLRARHAAKGNN